MIVWMDGGIMPKWVKGLWLERWGFDSNYFSGPRSGVDQDSGT